MIATSSPEPDNNGDKETGYLPEGITTASEEWYEN